MTNPVRIPSPIVEELYKRMMEKEAELDNIINDYIDKGVIRVDGTYRNLQHIQVWNIIDHIQGVRNKMINYTNQWREFKRMEEEK